MVVSVLSSLRARLVLLVVLALIPTFGLILWTNLEQRGRERERAEEELLSLAQVTAAQQEQLIEGGRQFLATLAGLVSTSQSGEAIDVTACNSALAELLAQNPRYANVGIADGGGMIFCSGLPQAQPTDASQRSWFQRATLTKQFAVGDYQVGSITKRQSVNFGYPVLDEQGNVGLVVFAALDLAWLNDEAARIRLPDGAILTIRDPLGHILVRSEAPESWIGHQEASGSLFNTIIAEGAGTTIADGVDGTERLYAFSPLGDPNQPYAYLSVGQSTATVFADANATLYRNLVFLGVVALLALAAAWVGGSWLVLRPVRTITTIAQRLRGGDLTARTNAGPGGGELLQLARDFDSMAKAVEERQAAHLAVQHDLRLAVEQLERRTDELAEANRALEERTSELQRSNTELEQFAYVASHDLQEPLRMVANYTQLLARRYEGRLDSDADEFIHYAADGAKRMQALINDLLTYSRVGTRGKPPVETDAESVLEYTLRDLRSAAEDAGATITHDPLPAVLADEGQLGQVFQNLIGNAIKFHGDSPPQVHVSARRNGHGYVFAVKDNGIGIDPEYFDRIFVIFQRLHGRSEYRGTGMGLAICKKIAERHGGRIWVESEPGVGSTFYFALPEPADVAAAA